LWFGWFGFNGGSALGANGTAALAVVNSQLAAAAGAVVWMTIDLLRLNKASSLGFASGFVAGLATVTPTAGFIGPMPAIAVGAAAGLCCYGGVLLKDRFGYDDSLDAFGVHGVGGIVGTLFLGLFASTAWNAAGANGLVHGGPRFLGVQAIAVVVAVVYCSGATFVILKAVNAITALRVRPDLEQDGLDSSYHGEAGYAPGATFGHATDASIEPTSERPVPFHPGAQHA
jgi:Amt family ammonium transporter